MRNTVASRTAEPRRGARYLAMAAALWWVGAAVPAGAQDAGAPGPWHEEADKASKERATALFEQAVALQKQWRLAEAADRYRQALEHWQHPQIYFYLSRNLEKLGDLIGAYHNLAQARRWGPRSLDAKERELADALTRRLASQLAFIEVRCDEPGTEVVLDGKPLFVAPGARAVVVRPGEHVVIARKEGYFTVTEAMATLPGNRTTVRLQMSRDHGTTVVRRFATWLPWTMLGVGAVSTLAGALLTRSADRSFEEIDGELLTACQPSCSPALDPAGLDAARLKQRMGLSATVVGVTAIAAGLAMIYFNQPRTFRDEPRDGTDIQIVPLVGPGAAGVSAAIEF